MNVDGFIDTLEAAQAGDRRALKSLMFVHRYGCDSAGRPTSASELVAAEQRLMNMTVTREGDGVLRVATRQLP